MTWLKIRPGIFFSFVYFSPAVGTYMYVQSKKKKKKKKKKKNEFQNMLNDSSFCDCFVNLRQGFLRDPAVPV